jgi:hypothetical protein
MKKVVAARQGILRFEANWWGWFEKTNPIGKGGVDGWRFRASKPMREGI